MVPYRGGPPIKYFMANSEGWIHLGFFIATGVSSKSFSSISS